MWITLDLDNGNNVYKELLNKTYTYMNLTLMSTDPLVLNLVCLCDAIWNQLIPREEFCQLSYDFVYLPSKDGARNISWRSKFPIWDFPYIALGHYNSFWHPCVPWTHWTFGAIAHLCQCWNNILHWIRKFDSSLEQTQSYKKIIQASKLLLFDEKVLLKKL